MQKTDEMSVRLLTSIGAAIANIFILYIAITSGDENYFAAILLGVSFFIGAVQFSILIYSQFVRPLTFSLLLYWIYGFILPGIVQSRGGTYFWDSLAISEEITEPASLIVFTASVFMFFGMSISISTRRERLRQIDMSKSLNFSLILAFLLLIYCAFLLAWLGPAAYFLPRELAGLALRQQIGAESSLGNAFARTFPMSIAITVLALSISHSKNSKFSWRTLALLVMALASNFIVNFPPAIPRYFLVAMVFVFLILGAPGYFERFRNLIYFSSPIFLYYIFPILGKWNRGPEMSSGSSYLTIQEYMSDGDLDGFQSIMNIVHLTDLQGYSYGGRILSAVLFYIPRSFWTSKYEATGSDAAELAGYSFLNISMPIPGEFFADFGLIGVAVGMFGFGALVRALEGSFLRTQKAGVSFYSILIATISGFMPIVARGPLLSTVQALILSISIVIIWSHFSTKRR